jgi:hypothetical protein
MKRWILSLLSTIAVIGASFMLGNAQANAATCWTDEGYYQWNFRADGVQTDINHRDLAVGITTRQFGSCSGQLPNDVDAAASVHDYTTTAILHVQISGVWLMGADTNVVRAYNGTIYNDSVYVESNTPNVCVSPFGSGAYKGVVQMSWREHDNTLHNFSLASLHGPSRYATVSC